MNSILALVLMMAAVTYIPRLIPLIVVKADRLPEKLKILLSYIPYAVLGALIIPDGIWGIPDKPWISVTVLIIAGIVSWLKNNVILALVISVTAAWGLQLLAS